MWYLCTCNGVMTAVDVAIVAQNAERILFPNKMRWTDVHPWFFAERGKPWNQVNTMACRSSTRPNRRLHPGNRVEVVDNNSQVRYNHEKFTSVENSPHGTNGQKCTRGTTSAKCPSASIKSRCLRAHDHRRRAVK